MLLTKIIKRVITKIDLFSSIQLLRFQGEAQTKTFTGGIVSFAIIMYLVATFSTMIADTFNKLIITSTQDSTQANQPEPLYLQTTNNASHFMLGVQVLNLDLNSGPRYFDVVLLNSFMANGIALNSTIQYTMQPCTKAHWQAIPNISSIYDKVQMNKWLCMPLNITPVIQGKYYSNLQTTLNVYLKKCDNNTDPLRPCAPQEQVDSYLTQNSPVYFTPYFINPLINPQNKDYLSLYIQDRYYALFGVDFGMEMYIYNAGFKITTDQSILPYSDTHTDNGSILTGVNNNAYNLGNSQIYSYVGFFRDPSTLIINRKYQKIEDALSYVGGLLGSFLLVLVFINFYNECSFEMKFATIYKVQKDSPTTTKNFNFVYYILQAFYNFLTIIKIRCKKWKSIAYFHETRQEMIRQLDVQYLFRKLQILENAMMLILTEPQIKGLMLQHKMTVGQSKKMRRIYGVKGKLKRHFRQKFKENDQNFDKRDQSSFKINLDLISSNKRDQQLQVSNQIIPPSKQVQRPATSFSQQSLKKAMSYISSSQSGQSSDQSSNGQNTQDFTEKLINDLHALKSECRKSKISKSIFNNLDPFIKHILQMKSHQAKEVVELNTVQRNQQYATRQLAQYQQIKLNPKAECSLQEINNPINNPKQKEYMEFQFIDDIDR